MFKVLENAHSYIVEFNFDFQEFGPLPKGFNYNMNEDRCIVGIYCDKTDYHKNGLISLCEKYFKEQQYSRSEIEYCKYMADLRIQEEKEYCFKEWIKTYTTNKYNESIEQQMLNQENIDKFDEYEKNNI